MITIDGITYDVPVVSIKRKADFLDRFAERTGDGVLHRELIGVYINYQMQLGRTGNVSEYAALWLKLTEPVEFHTVTVPDVSGNLTFTAYFSNVSDEVRFIRDGVNFWKNPTVDFIAKSPTRS